MEGSTHIRLRAFLETTGTKHSWLIAQLGVSKACFSEWLSGKNTVPVRYQHEIIEVLRRRQLEAIPSGLFDRDDVEVGHAGE